MLSPGLIKLLRLHLGAKFRWMFRGGRKGRSFLFLIVGFFVLTAWIIPMMIDHAKHGRSDPSHVRIYLPALLLTFCIANLVTAAGERAIAFTPAESDFLFPAPFTRRELLIYKILKSAGSALLSALIFGTVFWNYAPAWIAAFLACFLALMFLQLLSMAIMLAILSVGERARTRFRRFVLCAVLIAIGFALAPIIATGRTHGQIRIARGLQDSAIVHVMLAPFDVFGRIIAAPNLWPAAWSWIGIGAAMVVACIVVVLVLDTQYLDAAAAAGRRRYDTHQRARTRGIGAGPTSSRLRAPALPRMGGVGPIAWRQLTTAVRHSRGLLTLLIMVGIGAGIFVFAQRESGKPLQPTIGVVIWASIMLSNSLRLDFRGDVDLIDTLKALPLRASTICTGELVAPAILMSLFHLSVIVMAMIALPQKTSLLLLGAALVLPANFILFGVENLSFLIFPTRFASASPGDLQGSGRMVLVMFLKMIAFGVVLSIAGGIGAIVYFVSESVPLLLITLLLTLIAEVVGLIALMSIAFVRFDPEHSHAGLMHIPTHILRGWCVANCFRMSPRQRLMCMIAAAAPDIDGVGIIFGQATYQTYHHLLGHNLLLITVVAIICAAFSPDKRALIFALCFALGHLYLVMDYFGSGPNWPIYYLWPFDWKYKIVNPTSWEFFSWQNMLVFAIFLALTIVIAIRSRRTPLEVIAPRFDRALVGAG